MCVFNFFIRKSWLAGEGDYLLRTRKLKMGFCGCSDTRRAFSRACIAKCAYHKPPLRGGWALRPCGAATRRRPSRRGPQRPWGNKADAPPPGGAGCGRKGPSAGKKGISYLSCLICGGISSQSTKCRSPFACSRPAFPRCEIKFEARRPECARFYQANWPRQARDGAGPRSARTDSPMPAALSFFRCTALRAPCFHFFGTRRACLFVVV